ncbi:MAG: hypothetical protein JRH19_24190 [Deltaproteobacteria bacterium]|nr:hypothetical protein [Deltaproteobacteria bacterium]
MLLLRRIRAAGLASLILSLVACGGPIVMIPGGELSGKVEAVPSDWSFTDSVETMQLETRPADPYSVNIWGASVGDRFYIGCGNPEKGWCKYVLEDPNVRLRVNDSIYELRAEPIENEPELEAYLAGLKKKYDREVSPEERGQAVAFALTARE